MSAYENNRRFLRIGHRTRINCFGGGTYVSDYSLNIGGGGLAFNTIQEIPPATELQLEFRLPDSENEISLKSRVIWTSGGNNNTPDFGSSVGVEFLGDENSQDLERVREFVQRKIGESDKAN